jgi:hypothetical protein
MAHKIIDYIRHVCKWPVNPDCRGPTHSGTMDCVLCTIKSTQEVFAFKRVKTQMSIWNFYLFSLFFIEPISSNQLVAQCKFALRIHKCGEKKSKTPNEYCCSKESYLEWQYSNIQGLERIPYEWNSTLESNKTIPWTSYCNQVSTDEYTCFCSRPTVAVILTDSF